MLSSIAFFVPRTSLCTTAKTHRAARLLGKDVHRRSAHVPLVNGPLQSLRIVQKAARRVDESPRAVFRAVRAELAEMVVVEQARVGLSLRVFGGDMDGHEIPLPEGLREGGAGRPSQRGADLLRHVGPVVEADVHAKGVGQAGELLANVAQAYDRERLVHQLVPARAVLRPPVLPPRLVGRVEAAGQHNHLADDHLHHRAPIADRVVEHQYAFVRAGGLVHRVVADAAEHDGRQIVGGLHHVLVNNEFAALIDEVVLPLAQAFHHRVLIVAVRLGHTIRLDALLAQVVVETGVGLFEDEGFLKVRVQKPSLRMLHASVGKVGGP